MEDDPGNDECPHCSRKEKEMEAVEFAKSEILSFFKRVGTGENKVIAQKEMFENIDKKVKEVMQDETKTQRTTTDV